MSKSNKIIELGLIDFYGRDGLWVESLGSLHTDIYGLSTASAVWVSPVSKMKTVLMLSPHPLWKFMHVEKRTQNVEYGFLRTTCEYAGFEGIPVPIIEWSSGSGQEPIQCHPNFASFAGTASSPLNDARWVDMETRAPSTDNSRAVFDHFGGTGDFAGITSFMTSHVVKKETRIEDHALAVVGIGKLDGGMLKICASSIQRGIAFQNTQEWRGPGVRPFNSSIYG